MRRYAFLVATPVLLLAACTETEWPTGVVTPNTVSPDVLTAGVATPGSIVAWGSDEFGQVSQVPAGSDFVAVAAGGRHSVTLREDGSLVSWGRDNFDQVSDTPSGSDFLAVAAGSDHSVALRADGSLVSWGWDGFGQVSGTPAGNDFVAVAAGWSHGMALREDGSLTSWGDNTSGQVSGTPAGNDFIAAAAGTDHSVALREDGSLASWGGDGNGQVSGTPSGNDFIAVAVGSKHNVALREDGSLVSWGLDHFDQVSDTPAGNDFVAVTAGWSHSAALREDGSLVSWGEDTDNTVSDTPAGNDFVAVAAGGQGTSYAIQRVPVDELPPSIILTSPADGAVYLLGETVAADYTCDDEQSGVISCEGPVPDGESINTASVGARTFEVVAEDGAGNVASIHHRYAVAYDYDGFFAPVSNDGANVVKSGRTIPLKWRLLDSIGQPVTGLADVDVTVEDTACELGSTDDLIQESAPGASGLRYLGDGYYQFNWKTPKAYAGSCKMLHLDLGEGLTRTALFRFTR